MDVQKLTLAVATVPRQPQYIHQTLASLFASDPLVNDLPAVHLNNPKILLVLLGDPDLFHGPPEHLILLLQNRIHIGRLDFVFSAPGKSQELFG